MSCGCQSIYSNFSTICQNSILKTCPPAPPADNDGLSSCDITTIILGVLLFLLLIILIVLSILYFRKQNQSSGKYPRLIE